MGAFEQTLQAAADSFFLLPGAEWILYRPRSGSVRRIRAVVSRADASALPGLSDGSRSQLAILVKNHATGGIRSDAIDTGGDKVDIAPRQGEAPRPMRLTEIINQDAGLMLIAVQ